MPKYEVTLTAMEVESARQWESEVLRALTARTGSNDQNYTGLVAKDRYFVGRCGEMAFANWCAEFDIEYEWTESIPGFGDRHDFELKTFDGNLVSIDVKNSHHPNAKMLMVPHEQWQKHHHDAYIGCTGKQTTDGLKIILHGYVLRDWFAHRTTPVMLECMTMQYPLNQLTALDPNDFRRRAA